MIASIKGIVDALGQDFIIVNVNGVGFRITVPTSVLSQSGVTGRDIKLYTHLHVREDDLSLYGFDTADGLRLFELLLTVSGLGPRTAIGLLSAMNSEELTMSIAAGSTEMLTSVPGIGKKTAERLILELKDKVGGVMISTATGQMAQENADVVAALASLGYTVGEASRAVAALPAGKKLSLEDKIKLALQSLVGSK